MSQQSELLHLARRVETFLTALDESNTWLDKSNQPISVIEIRDAVRQAIANANGNSTDTERLNALESYLSTEGYRYKLASQYDNRKPYSSSLREAIDARIALNATKPPQTPENASEGSQEAARGD